MVWKCPKCGFVDDSNGEHKKILDVVRKRGPISLSELTRAVKGKKEVHARDWNSVRGRVQLLERKGILKTKKQGKERFVVLA